MCKKGMRVKYYLRGFGTGVLVATIILMIAFEIQSNSKMSKEEESVTTEDVMKKDESNTTSDDTTSPAIQDTSKEGTSEDATMDTTEETPQETTQEDTTSQDEASDVTMDTTTEQKDSSVIHTETNPQTESNSETTPQATSETQIGNTIPANGQTVTLVITSGMISNRAADILEELGAVSDGEDLNWYLHNNGYSNKLRVGEFQIPVGASYEEIAQIITGRK